jgi:hypothetical protein
MIQTPNHILALFTPKASKTEPELLPRDKTPTEDQIYNHFFKVLYWWDQLDEFIICKVRESQDPQIRLVDHLRAIEFRANQHEYRRIDRLDIEAYCSKKQAALEQENAELMAKNIADGTPCPPPKEMHEWEKVSGEPATSRCVIRMPTRIDNRIHPGFGFFDRVSVKGVTRTKWIEYVKEIGHCSYKKMSKTQAEIERERLIEREMKEARADCRAEHRAKYTKEKLEDMWAAFVLEEQHEAARREEVRKVMEERHRLIEKKRKAADNAW